MSTWILIWILIYTILIALNHVFPSNLQMGSSKLSRLKRFTSSNHLIQREYKFLNIDIEKVMVDQKVIVNYSCVMIKSNTHLNWLSKPSRLYNINIFSFKKRKTKVKKETSFNMCSSMCQIRCDLKHVPPDGWFYIVFEFTWIVWFTPAGWSAILLGMINCWPWAWL